MNNKTIFDDYDQKIYKKAFDSFNRIGIVEDRLDQLRDELGDIGWCIQALSYQIFKECGLYEFYRSDLKLNCKFVSDMIMDAFYGSNSLDEVYDEFNYILLQIEDGNLL